jgi:hypothetical protein
MNRQLLILAAALLLLMPACQADQSGGETDVFGTVHDSSFDSIAGFAEKFGDEYVLTLSDDPSYTCTTNPTANYLSVVMSGVDDSGTYSAAGNVTFNEVNNLGVIEQQAATSGSFTVTVLVEPNDDESLEGSIEASGRTSSVSGTFEVPVCD